MRTEILSHHWGRMFVVLSCWLAFWFATSYYNWKYVDDIGSAIWAQGIYATPIVVSIIWFLDKVLGRFHLFRGRHGLLTTVDIICCIALYPIGLLVLLIMLQMEAYVA